MARIMLHRYGYNDPDRFINRSVRSPEEVADGLLMGTFVSNRVTRYCIKSTEDPQGMWVEVQTGFPLIKKYEELFG